MSNNKFIKTMRAKMAETGKISPKLAKKVSIQISAGVKQVSLQTAAQKKVYTQGMEEEGLLSVMYHKNPKLALEAYKRAAETASSGEHKATHLDAHGFGGANDNIEHDAEVDPRAEADHRHETHDRMQKIRDQIEAGKKSKQAKEVSVTQKVRADDQAGATGSISHVSSNKLGEKTPESHTTHMGLDGQGALGSINTRANQKVAGSINQVLDKKAVNDNVEDKISFGGPIGAANDNEEHDAPGLKKVA